MKRLLVIMLCIAAYSCTSTKSEPVCKHNTPGAIMIIPSDSVSGRATYTVIFDDEKALDFMYAEEIANGLLTNNWEPNEDLKITDK
jgi:hypothetical protein